MEQVQFIQTTPEELQKSILAGIDKKLNELKEQFQPKEPTKYIAREEVAKMLNISISTVERWTKKGKLNAYGIGRRIYYKHTEIEAALIEISPRRAKQ
jgi:excisionase family DNA binding protein